MQDILNGLTGICCLMNNIILYGESQEAHDRDVEAALQCLEERVTLNKKSVIFPRLPSATLVRLSLIEGLRLVLPK